MIQATKDKLFEAWAYCDELDKSTEYMIQYMVDFTNVPYDSVVVFLSIVKKEERQNWYKNNPDWFKKYPEIK